jgi:hypothetical protein
LTEGATAKAILTETEALHIADIGYGFILSPESSLFVTSKEDSSTKILRNGLIAVVDEGCESAVTVSQRVSCSFKTLIGNINSALEKERTNSAVVTKLEILKTARAFFDPQTRYRNPNYSIVNITDGQRVAIGTTGQTLGEA